MNCLLNALAMSFGLMCVLSLKVIELLSLEIVFSVCIVRRGAVGARVW